MTATFSQLLASEITAVQRFVVLLEREQEALRSGKLDELERLTAEKGKLVDQLATIGQQRNVCFEALGITEGSTGVDAWLLKQQNPKFLQAWKVLQELARKAKSINEINGQCIALLSRNNRQLMDAISGQRARGTFYGPDGQTSSSSGFRISDSV